MTTTHNSLSPRSKKALIAGILTILLLAGVALFASFSTPIGQTTTQTQTITGRFTTTQLVTITAPAQICGPSGVCSTTTVTDTRQETITTISTVSGSTTLITVSVTATGPTTTQTVTGSTTTVTKPVSTSSVTTATTSVYTGPTENTCVTGTWYGQYTDPSVNSQKNNINFVAPTYAQGYALITEFPPAWMSGCHVSNPGQGTSSSTTTTTPITTSTTHSTSTSTTQTNNILPVNLGTAGNFAILAKAGISATGTVSVVGNIGVSPITATAITGFGLIADSSNQWATSSLVTGKVYAADYAPPTPINMGISVGDMQTAYTDAAGRTNPTATELGAGDISGMTLTPGLYKWGTGVIINGGVTLDCKGNSNGVYIFQIAQTLNLGNAASVTLAGGCQAKNIFWQTGGQATLGTTSNMKGTILSQTAIVLNTGASLTGRALAQTAVTMNGNSIISP